MQSTLRKLVLMAVVVGLTFVSISQRAEAGYGQRQYYSSWGYSNSNSYYYTSYYYRPVATVESYHRHYCVYYPSQPRYVYYYNPSRRVYWGRYDLKEKGYSLLAEEDRKEKLTDIPEEAFPAPASMPLIPDAEDGEKVAPIAADSIPTIESPKELPVK